MAWLIILVILIIWYFNSTKDKINPDSPNIVLQSEVKKQNFELSNSNTENVSFTMTDLSGPETVLPYDTEIMFARRRANYGTNWMIKSLKLIQTDKIELIGYGGGAKFGPFQINNVGNITDFKSYVYSFPDLINQKGLFLDGWRDTDALYFLKITKG